MTTTNDIRISAPHTSIWGTIQHRKKLANGVYSVDTASHGGIMVHTSVADRYISRKAREIIKRPEKGWWHFEEDCDWAIFAHENREIVPGQWLPYIDNALKNYYPDFLTKESLTLSNGETVKLVTRDYPDRKVYDCKDRKEALMVSLTLTEIGNICRVCNYARTEYCVITVKEQQP